MLDTKNHLIGAKRNLIEEREHEKRIQVIKELASNENLFYALLMAFFNVQYCPYNMTNEN